MTLNTKDRNVRFRYGLDGEWNDDPKRERSESRLFQIAFGNQTFCFFQLGEKETLGFASLPHGRFAFIGAFF